MRINPLLIPIETGINLIVSMLLLPGTMVNEDGLALKEISVLIIPKIFSVSLPVFDIVTVVSFHCPILIVGNAIVLRLRKSIGVLIPFPETWMVSGEEDELLVSTNEPVTCPDKLGENRSVSDID
jgi:hypothetical protein